MRELHGEKAIGKGSRILHAMEGNMDDSEVSSWDLEEEIIRQGSWQETMLVVALLSFAYCSFRHEKRSSSRLR